MRKVSPSYKILITVDSSVNMYLMFLDLNCSDVDSDSSENSSSDLECTENLSKLELKS